MPSDDYILAREAMQKVKEKSEDMVNNHTITNMAQSVYKLYEQL